MAKKDLLVDALDSEGREVAYLRRSRQDGRAGICKAEQRSGTPGDSYSPTGIFRVG